MHKLNKSQLRSARTKILHQISVLDTQRCDYCIPDDESTWRQPVAHCNCEAAVKVRELGDVLMSLVSERVTAEHVGEEIDIPDFDFRGVTIKTLPVKVYREAKAQGLTDAMIAHGLGTTKRTVDRWKYRMGISKRQRRAGLK